MTAERRQVRAVTAFHSPFYTPVYVARRLGAFADEGLDVELIAPGEAGMTPDLLARGEADVAVSGPMRSYVAADRTPPRWLLSIAEVNSRDGFLLLARKPVHDFRWTDLVGKRVVVFAEAPTPWMCLLEVLKTNGVDPTSISVTRDLPVPRALEAFVRGDTDYLETGQPMAEELLEDGTAHLAAAVGEAVGEIPYSSLIVAAETRKARPQLCEAAVRALARVQRWMAGVEPDTIADLIAPDFPAIRLPILRKVVARYQKMGTWPDHPVLAREPFERLGRILVAGGLIHRAAPFEALADNTFAEAAVRALTAGALARERGITLPAEAVPPETTR